MEDCHGHGLDRDSSFETPGGVAERLKATVLKTVRRVTVSGVRIPPPPLFRDWGLETRSSRVHYPNVPTRAASCGPTGALLGVAV